VSEGSSERAIWRAGTFRDEIHEMAPQFLGAGVVPIDKEVICIRMKDIVMWAICRFRLTMRPLQGEIWWSLSPE